MILIHQCLYEAGNWKKHDYLVVSRENAYFMKKTTLNPTKRSLSLPLLKWWYFWSTTSQQTIEIPKRTNCAQFLADLLLHSFEINYLLQMKMKLKRQLIHLILLHTLASICTCNFIIKRDDFDFFIVKFPFLLAIHQHLQSLEYTFHSRPVTVE